jgi:hypothetical protein
MMVGGLAGPWRSDAAVHYSQASLIIYQFRPEEEQPGQEFYLASKTRSNSRGLKHIPYS